MGVWVRKDVLERVGLQGLDGLGQLKSIGKWEMEEGQPESDRIPTTTPLGVIDDKKRCLAIS
ncbi:hypothetical protein AMTR_s00127p00059660 [Amborella trichopoda]|uniref:Uncharacterized protein n=1 Tax=Amborella trichopoda TaxID=13333 RepID=W1NRN7_AMBTC|nr:hypothetical protein AMTR_s00127p00059660 [Amborella trichopoda]